MTQTIEAPPRSDTYDLNDPAQAQAARERFRQLREHDKCLMVGYTTPEGHDRGEGVTEYPADSPFVRAISPLVGG